MLGKISIYYNGIKDIQSGGEVEPIKVLDWIKNGQWKLNIEDLRNTPAGEDYKRAKQMLPYVTWSGTFDKRGNDHLKQHSGLLCLDIDKCGKLFGKMRGIVVGDKYTYACFTSPGGDGLKVLVKIGGPHDACFDALKAYYKEQLGITIDASGRDVSRACFVSYDPALYMNESAVIFMPRKAVKETASKLSDEAKEQFLASAERKAAYARVMYICQQIKDNGIDITDDYSQEWLMIAMCLAGTFGEAGREFFHTISEQSPKYKKAAADKKFDNALRTTRFTNCAKLFKIAEDYGIDTRPDAIDVKKTENKKDIFRERLDEEESTETIKCYIGKFWITYYDTKSKKAEVKLIYQRLASFLAENGFCRLLILSTIAPDSYKFVRVTDNVVKPVDVQTMKDFTFQWCAENEIRYQVIEMLIRGSKNYFNANVLDRIPLVHINFKRDTKHEACLYFKERFYSITADSIMAKPYKEMEGTIWLSSIINRSVALLPADKVAQSDFYRFLLLAVTRREKLSDCSEEEKQKFESVCSGIGYMLHGYKDAANARAFNIFDCKISKGSAEGRNGKSMIFKALEHVKKGVKIDGKSIDWRNQKLFSEVSLDTSFIYFNDVKKNFDFENLFHIITEGLTVIKLYENPFTLTFDDSPKVGLTSNYSLKGDGGSFQDRQFNVELTDFWNPGNKPNDYFKRLFFIEWDEEQWNAFYSFMMGCIQLYLKKGLVPFPQGNIKLKKLILEIGEEFFTWAEDYIKLNDRIEKKIMFDDFKNAAGEDFRNVRQNTFSIWLLKYADYKGYKINAHCMLKPGERIARDRSNGIDFITFTAAQVPQAIDDIPHDYSLENEMEEW